MSFSRNLIPDSDTTNVVGVALASSQIARASNRPASGITMPTPKIKSPKLSKIPPRSRPCIIVAKTQVTAPATSGAMQPNIVCHLYGSGGGPSNSFPSPFTHMSYSGILHSPASAMTGNIAPIINAQPIELTKALRFAVSSSYEKGMGMDTGAAAAASAAAISSVEGAGSSRL